MQLKLSDFRSKLGRKFLLLLFLVAFLPMILLASFSYNYVGVYLYQQSQKDLQDEARFYSALMYERLLLMASEFSVAANSDGWPVQGESFSQVGQLNSIGLDGKLLHLPASDHRATWERLQSGALVLVSQNNGTALLAQKMSAEEQAEPLFFSAEINVARLVGKYEIQDIDMNYCIFGSYNERLYCSKGYLIADDQFGQLQLENGMRPSFSTQWTSAGEDHIVQVRSVFLSSRFGAPSWKVWVSEPTERVYRALDVLQRLFSLVAAITILLAVLGGAWQIKRILQPLRKFTDATRAISEGHFESVIEVDSGDELRDLADAFNQMAQQIGKQFRLLTGFSNIDQLILNVPDLDQVAHSALSTLQSLVASDWASVALRNPEQVNELWLFDFSRSEGLTNFMQRTLSEDEQHWLGAIDPMHRVTPEDGRYLSWLWPDHKNNHQGGGFVFPITANSKNRGVLALGWDRDFDLSEQDRSLLRDFADRLAVAITAVRREKKLYQQAHFDTLTQLPNRQLLKDRLHQALKHALRNQGSGAVLFVDLDNFKSVNETEGHSLGDEILIRTAERLQVCVTGEDTVARQGSDEFIVVVNDIDSPMRATRVANKILTMLSSPYNIDNKRYFLNCSIGIAVFPSDGMDVESLLRKADTSLHRVKAEGGGHYRYYEEEMNRASQRRMMAERRIREALDQSKIELHYQPQWYVSEGFFNVEALVRLHDQELGLMTPGEFIDVAEDTGLIIDVGEWVIRKACEQMALWHSNGVPVKRVSVNVSGYQLARTDFVKVVESALAEYGLGYQDLELEVTESILINDADSVIKKLRALSELGVSIAIDDFGTGYSSLSYLHSLPFDLVKIDQSFVTGLASNQSSEEITRTIISLAKSLNKKVMAEGVESELEFEKLRNMECDAIQGFLICRPLAAEKMHEFLTNFKPQVKSPT